MLNLFITSFFIKWLRDENSEKYAGYLYAILLGVLLLITAYTRNYFLLISSRSGVSIRKGLSGLIFKKILRFNQKSKATATSGKLVAIVSGELQLLERGLITIPFIVSAPFTLIFAFILIGILFKEAVLFGLVVAFIIFGLEIFASHYTNKFKYREGLFSDKRLKTISDIVNGIRTIKAYAWELPFFNLVNKYRKKMVWNAYKSQSIESSMWGIAGCGGYIVGIPIFGYHFAMGRKFEYEDSLSAIAILGFSSLLVFHQMYMAISMFSNLLAILKRVGEVLDMGEFKNDAIEEAKDDSKDKVRVNFENASLTWGFSIKKDASPGQKIQEDLNDTNLKDINLKVKDGDLFAIVGTVGCGKSTFLSAIMKELVVTKGEVSLKD